MTDDPERKIAELEQQLFDERRERDQAQRRSAELFDRVALWRKRAEDRTERIKKLESERDKLRGATGWLRRQRSGPPNSNQTTPSTVAPSKPDGVTQPLLPAVRCVTAVVSPDLIVAANSFDTIVLDASASLMEPDVVLVDAEGFRRLPDDETRRLTEWASMSGRPPLVVTSDTASEIAQFAQSTIGTDDASGRFFDPKLWNPLTLRDADKPASGSAVIDAEGAGPVLRETFDRDATRHLELAAMGVPFVPGGADGLTVEELRRLSVQFRRLAHAHRITQIERFVTQLTLDAPALRPTVAGVLISNRPDDAARAIERLGSQRVTNFEALVGCHGFSSSHLSRAIDDLAMNTQVTVMEFPVDQSLGACLNDAIAATGADVIAKMDDDDHYGPAYLVDAIQALDYSGASIIGKGSSFTYLESEDRTVLRRPGNEERFYNGSPTGATLVLTRALWEANPFPHRSLGEDVAFLRGARRLGHRIYVNSAYEFVYHRRRAGNTWQAADSVFLEGAEPAWDGEQPARADVPTLRVADL